MMKPLPIVERIARMKAKGIRLSPNDQLLFECEEHHQCPNVEINSTQVRSHIEEIMEIAGGSGQFHSRSYLDRLALICIASGMYQCENEACGKYRKAIAEVMPRCDSWTGFRDWALAITACAAVFSEYSHDPAKQRDNATHKASPVMARFNIYIRACIDLTQNNTVFVFLHNREVFPSCPGKLDEHTFPRAQTVPIDIAEVCDVINWFRCCLPGSAWLFSEDSPYWIDDRFTDAVIPAVMRAADKVRSAGFCQQRVWDIVRHSPGKEMELPSLMTFLERHSGRLRHHGHNACTPDFCEFTTLNFTKVAQLHKCDSNEPTEHSSPANANLCQPTKDGMFSPGLLESAILVNEKSLTTAWSLCGRTLVPKGVDYLAISHVWSDGTGVGAWKPGHVNECLWQFFVDTARGLRCEGIWWDTVCIPQEKSARAMAMNSMHVNYKEAKYTLVHDRYLLGIEWADDGSPCLALVLSPWFTRGWTALELSLSQNVKVLFKNSAGKGHVLKDLDRDILANNQFLTSRAHWIASYAIRRLRAGFKNVNDLLVALGSRYTSWSNDRPIIAGLLAGLTDHSGLQQQEIYKAILLKLQKISYTSLLHGHPTMSGPGFTWCPANIFDLPTGGTFYTCDIDPDGNVGGLWYLQPVTEHDVSSGKISAYSSHLYVRSNIRSALKEPRKCAILFFLYDGARGLLVRAMVSHKTGVPLHCKYIGCVNVRERSLKGLEEHPVIISDGQGMVEVEDVQEEMAILMKLRRPTLAM